LVGWYAATKSLTAKGKGEDALGKGEASNNKNEHMEGKERKGSRTARSKDSLIWSTLNGDGGRATILETTSVLR
jgi:hypothetical protein